jgi:hypothetical protein
MSEEGLINIETMRYGNKSSYSHKPQKQPVNARTKITKATFQ